MLYSGPLPEAKVVLPMGEFHLIAEIHEEAGAYAQFDIDTRFPTYLPDQQDYEKVDIRAMLARYAEIGDQARVSQILQADVINSYTLKCKKLWNHIPEQKSFYLIINISKVVDASKVNL